MTRCGVCDQPIDVKVEDVRSVVMGNGLIITACLACWLKWPNEKKYHSV